MKPLDYEPAQADALAPLLASIGREIEERSLRLAELEARQARLASLADAQAAARVLEAELALERRELRHARAELAALGCTVIGTEPLTIRIPTRVGARRRSRMWQRGRAPRR